MLFKNANSKNELNIVTFINPYILFTFRTLSRYTLACLETYCNVAISKQANKRSLTVFCISKQTNM